MTDEHDDALDAADRAALARWQPEGPPAGFADRVMAARTAAPARAPRRWRFAAVAAVVAAAAAVAVVATRPPATSARLDVASAPLRAVDARETVAIGGRAVAVAEPGAALAYVVGGGAAHVEQPRGDVFYRVEPGGRFDVVTPAGTIEVTGTCFRVEVQEMIGKQAILAGALGAAVASAAVITVYEGKIRVVGGGGAPPVEVQAGERATLTPGTPSTVAVGPTPVSAAGGPVAVKVGGPPEPAAETLTREQLIERDKAQREQLAALTQRLAQLEAGGGKRRPGPGGDENWLDTTAEQYKEFAKTCKVQIDFPPVMRGRPMMVQPETAKSVGLTDGEVAAANAAFTQVQNDWNRRVREWYVEGTGDATGADSLSADAMGQELQDKAAPGEPNAVQKRISQERAGLARPPSDLSKVSPYERYFRALAELGNETERVLATAIGPQKAHAIRAENGGWPARMSMDGCGDEDDAAAIPSIPGQ